MAIKDEMMKRGMKMMSDPRMMKLMENPQFMKVMQALLQVPGKVNTFTNAQAEKLATSLKLATAQEVKELRRTVTRLEKELSKVKERADRPGA